MRFWFAVVLFASVLLLGFGCSSGCGEGYSEGSRIGVITKLSKKGYYFKSYEGEMVLGGTRAAESGVVANVWAFHVPERLAGKVEAAKNSGQPVNITYHEWAISPIAQDSDYDVVSIALVATTAPTPTSAPAATP